MSGFIGECEGTKRITDRWLLVSGYWPLVSGHVSLVTRFLYSTDDGTQKWCTLNRLNWITGIKLCDDRIFYLPAESPDQRLIPVEAGQE
jgi:hypothetical protein